MNKIYDVRVFMKVLMIKIVFSPLWLSLVFYQCSYWLFVAMGLLKTEKKYTPFNKKDLMELFDYWRM